MAADYLLNYCVGLQKSKVEGEKQEEPLWKDKNGTSHQQIEEVADIKKSFQRLEKAGLKDSTEAIIMAAHEHHRTRDPGCAKMSLKQFSSD